MTNTNPNVMYELGYADALDKVVILLNQDVEASPFDIQVLRQIAYAPRDVGSVVTRLREFVRTALALDTPAGEQEPRQPAALAPTILRPAVDHGPGPFNMRPSGELNCWLVNDGPSTVEIDQVRLHHQADVLAGYVCAQNGEPLNSSIVPVHAQAHLQFAPTPATAAIRNDRAGVLELDVRFRDPRSQERWWVTFVLRRGPDTGSRAQWAATSLIGPRVERDS